VTGRGARMEQGKAFTLHVTDLNHSGEGVGRKDGRVVFVPYAAPGDVAVVRITEERRGFSRAELLSLERESPDRVPPPCPVYLRCGGCQLQHISYEAQLAYKRRRVEQALRRIGKFDDVPVGDCLPAPAVFHYRNKARFSYCTCRDGPGLGLGLGLGLGPGDGSGGAAGDGHAQGAKCGGERSGFASGFYGRRTHDVVDFSECLIQHRTNNEVFQALNALLVRYGIPIWNGASGGPAAAGAGGVCGATRGLRWEPGQARASVSRKGALKHLVVRCNRDGEQALAVLIPAGGRLDEAERIADELMAAVPKLVGVIEAVEEPGSTGRGGATLEPGQPGQVSGGLSQPRCAGARLVKGESFFRERILGLEFVVSADSFLQVNPEGMEVLYREVLRAAGLSGGEVALDAYCGVGSISLVLARECGQVFGIEEVGSAVADARRNARLNHLENCTFIAGRVEDVLSARFGFGIDAGVVAEVPASLPYREAGGREDAPGRGTREIREASVLPRHVDVAVLDPPRAGCDARALQALALLEPSRIVYVSCDPETLARDLRILAGIGYRPTLVQPVDMFPQTSHVESVVRLKQS